MSYIPVVEDIKLVWSVQLNDSEYFQIKCCCQKYGILQCIYFFQKSELPTLPNQMCSLLYALVFLWFQINSKKKDVSISWDVH